MLGFVHRWQNGDMPETLSNPLLSGPFARVLIELRWGDMDAYGHVNNVTQLRLLEEARVRAFGSPTADRDASAPAGIPGAGEPVQGTAFPAVLGEAAGTTDLLVFSHRIEYRRPISFRTGPVAVDTVISGLTPATMEVGYTIGEPDGSEIYTLAETTIAFVDSATGRARRLTDAEAAAIEPFVTDPVPLRPVRNRR